MSEPTSSAAPALRETTARPDLPPAIYNRVFYTLRDALCNQAGRARTVTDIADGLATALTPVLQAIVSPGEETSALTFAALRRANTARLLSTYPECVDWSLDRWMTCCTGELGEAANKLKKLAMPERYPDMTPEEVGKEIADLQIYLDLFTRALGLSLAELTRAKFNEVSERVGAVERL